MDPACITALEGTLAEARAGLARYGSR
jgi:hypothetical protein